MPTPRFSPKQVRRALQQLKKGYTAREISQKFGVSTTTVYRWRTKLRLQKKPTQTRLRALEMENRRLKNKFAELTLDYNSLRAALINERKIEC